MSDITGITNQTSITDGATALSGLKTAIGNLNSDKLEASALTPYVAKSLYDANTILYATTDNTPVALTVGTSTIVGRKASGDIVALSKSEAQTVLNVADGATANSKAASTDVDTGTNDVLFVTAKSIADSHNVPNVVPGTAGNVMKSDGTDWISDTITPTFTNGSTTKNAADASATQTIAHGLGKIPKKVKILALSCNAAGRYPCSAFTVYNGTTQSSASIIQSGSGNTTQSNSSNFVLNLADGGDTTVGVVTFDTTNISIAWTKTGSPTGTYNLVWEAEG